ncbi:MAG: glycine cleavage system protein GcvH [Chloroflexota bacterium]
MSDQPIIYKTDCKYLESHEWARQEGELIAIGVSDYAQNQLGDVVFVELPAIGKEVQAGKAFGVVESVKAASDLNAPVSGKVVAINENLSSDPALVNKDAFGGGWMIKVKPSNPAEFGKLLDAATYQKRIEAGELH